jgi:hypothetical protein
LLTATSIIPNVPKSNGATCLAVSLFESAGHTDILVGQDGRVIPSGGFPVRCEHCARKAFSIVGDCIVIDHRHDSQHHRSVISLAELGLKRI